MPVAVASVEFSDPMRFTLPPWLEATEPPEIRLGRRDGVRLMVSRGLHQPEHSVASNLASWLQPGDLVVVNTSATVPAAVDAALEGQVVVVHFSTERPDGRWLIEVRQPLANGSTAPLTEVASGARLLLPGSSSVRVIEPLPGSTRLWIAALDLSLPTLDYLERYGRAIRYRYVDRDWPIETYRNVYSDEPGSAEMPSAGRPITRQVLHSLWKRNVAVAPIVLHTGVASLEGNEMPYEEGYRVPAPTAAQVNAIRAAGRRVVAVGTTVVRALETVTGRDGITRAGAGWTDLVITPQRGVRAVNGLLSGWHEPEASHLQMLEAIAGRPALELAYGEAIDQGYLWHEFGDSHLLLPELRT